MAPPVPKPKASRAIIEFLKPLRAVFDELPLLEEAGSLEQHIASLRVKAEEVEGRVKQGEARASELVQKEADHRKQVNEETERVESVLKAKLAAADARVADAQTEADRIRAEATQRAESEVAKAQREAAKIREDAHVAVAKHKADTKAEITKLESKLTELRDSVAASEAASKKARENASRQIAALQGVAQ